MNTEKILRIISDRGLMCREGPFLEAGPTIDVKVPKMNLAIRGLIPIDDESDERFAEYLINEALKTELLS